MNELEAVNLILRAVGNPTVQNLDSPDENLALAQETLRRNRRTILKRGWTFNTNKVDLQVDNSGRVPLNASLLKARLPVGISYRTDGGTRYAWDVQKSKYVSTPILRVDVVFDIQHLENIDQTFSEWIARAAAAEFFEEKNNGQGNPVLYARMQAAQSDAVASEPPINVVRTMALSSRPDSQRQWVAIG